MHFVYQPRFVATAVIEIYSGPLISPNIQITAAQWLVFLTETRNIVPPS